MKSKKENINKLTSEHNIDDRVNHPSHYNTLGVEVIEITKHLDFCLGNVIKYVLRAGHKKENGMSEIQKEYEDLKKAKWYLDYKIKDFEDMYNLNTK